MGAARPPGASNRRWWRVYGQGLVEYALILVMIAVVCILVVTFLGTVVSEEMYSKINSGFPG